jgi:hypothetical protein
MFHQIEILPHRFIRIAVGPYQSIQTVTCKLTDSPHEKGAAFTAPFRQISSEPLIA